MKKGMGEPGNEMSSHAAHTRPRTRHEDSLAWQTESAMGFVLRSLREDGRVPRWGLCPRGLRRALRIARLRAGRLEWWSEHDPLPFVTAAGLDPVSGKIVDYELFYAHMEAYKAHDRRHLGRS